MINEALGEFIEVYNVEMKALKATLIMLYDLLSNGDPAAPTTTRIVISSDNMGALQ